MVLTDRVDLEAELVGESGLLDDLPQPLPGRNARIGDLSKCGQSKLHDRVTPPDETAYPHSKRGLISGRQATSISYDLKGSCRASSSN